jgi:drug/metabolite transporter (DMT)-like permease
MTQQTTLSTRAWAELTLLGVIWGGSFLAIRTALDEIGFLTSVFHRVFWAMLALWGVVLLRRLPIPRDPKIWGAFLVMGLLNNVIPFSLMAWGQLYIPSGLTSIFNAATAIFGVLVAALVFADERLTPRKALGVTLGFFGVCLAIGLDALKQFDTTSLAQIAIIAGTVSYAFASAWARKMLGGVQPVIAATGMLTGSSLIMIPLAVVVEGVPSLALGTTTWLSIGYYAIIATAFAYLLYYRVLGMAGSGNLMLVTLLIPPVAITLGALVRNETLHPGEYVGFAILALGLSIIDGRLWRRRTTTV